MSTKAVAGGRSATAESAPAMVSTVAASNPAGGPPSHVWEDISGSHMWANAVREDDEGNIIVDEGDNVAQAVRKRRKRLALQDYSQRNRRVVRDMIRYLYVVIDGSRWMRSKDPVLPGGTRMDMTINLLKQFIDEYYDQNPLSQVGLILLQNGEAEILTPLASGKPVHQRALTSLQRFVASQPPTAGGEFSLQNGLEVAGRSLGHQPAHGSREVVIVTAALSTCDPGHVLTETLPNLVASRIRVSCFALQAELHVCRKLTELTHGAMGVCLDKMHFRDWLMNQCVPPPSHRSDNENENAAIDFACEMVRMGFPTRTISEIPTIVHASRERTILTRTAYTCPQCQAKNSDLPTECAVCQLKLVLAPHLARSFHHLFPVAPFREKPIVTDPSVTGTFAGSLPVMSASLVKDSAIVSAIPSAGTGTSSANVAAATGDVIRRPLDESLLAKSTDDDGFCFSCLRPFIEEGDDQGEGFTDGDNDGKKKRKKGNGSSIVKRQKPQDWLRFECPHCRNLFCVDCDAFLHESLHNCPGCLSQ